MTTFTESRRALRWRHEEAPFIGRSLRLSLRNPETLLMAVLLPVMIMLMFTFVFGGSIDPGGDYVNYVVPGIILLCAGFGASSTAVDVATDMETGIIDRFRTMRMRSWAVLTGMLAPGWAATLSRPASASSAPWAGAFGPPAPWSGGVRR